MSHILLASDSSVYDVKCTKCGGTDAKWDDTLDYPCTGSPEDAAIEAAFREKIIKQSQYMTAVREYDELLKKRNSTSRSMNGESKV
jgi:hypothetical protein